MDQQKNAKNESPIKSNYTIMSTSFEEQIHIQVIDRKRMRQQKKLIDQLLNRRRSIFQNRQISRYAYYNSVPFTIHAQIPNTVNAKKKYHKKGISLYSARLSETNNVDFQENCSKFPNRPFYEENHNFNYQNQVNSLLWKKLNQIQTQIKEMEKIMEEQINQAKLSFRNNQMQIKPIKNKDNNPAEFIDKAKNVQFKSPFDFNILLLRKHSEQPNYDKI